MSYGKRWTKEDIDAMESIRKMRQRAKNGLPMIEQTKDLRGELSAHMPHLAPLAIKQIAPKKKPLMNKTELRFKAELERRGHKIILCQAITFRLGDRLTYRPDFVTVDALASEGTLIWLGDRIRLTCYETKAPHRFARAGIDKLKMAATIYPWIAWKLVMRKGNEWSEKEISNV